MCVFFNITSPLINIHFLNTLTAARLQSSPDISALCHLQAGGSKVGAGMAAECGLPSSVLLCPALSCSAQPCPAPHFSVNNHKTKPKSCQFSDPSPLSFNFLAGACLCCPVRCKNTQSQVGVSPDPNRLQLGIANPGHAFPSDYGISRVVPALLALASRWMMPPEAGNNCPALCCLSDLIA